MKPTFLKVRETSIQSFDIRREKIPYFTNPWHYHPELELALILESTGTRYVGDHIARFSPGELVLIGSNLPHYWQNDDEYHKQESPVSAEAIILRFKADIWGEGFWKAPESLEIKMLFQLAAQGIVFHQEVTDRVKPLLIALCQSQQSTRIRLWIQIFEILAQTKDYELLSSSTFLKVNASKDADRINQVLSYIQEHLTENLTLEAISGIAHMNPAAFCRYFKQQTNKTYIETVTEVRIHYACRLLAGTHKDIGQIAFESGFRNVSHFNQVFKAKTGGSPTQYRSRNIPTYATKKGD